MDITLLRGRQATTRLPLFVALLCLCTASVAHADDALDAIRQRGQLIWGADAEGGGPFVFPDPTEEDPDLISGFEVDIANLLAGRS